MNNKKTLLMLVCLIVLSAITYKATDIFTTAETYAYDGTPTIIIDAGHGGFDGGAVAEDGTMEKDINLSISKILKNQLLIRGYKVKMTRETDTGTDTNPQKNTIRSRKVDDMKNRLKLINSGDNVIFVSIHLNKFGNSKVNGAQVFYAPKSDGSEMLGEKIQKSIVSLLQPNNERQIKKGTKSTYLLYNAEKPSVIVECGFLSNYEELQMLKSETYQKKMAFAIASGITNYISESR